MALALAASLKPRAGVLCRCARSELDSENSAGDQPTCMSHHSQIVDKQIFVKSVCVRAVGRILVTSRIVLGLRTYRRGWDWKSGASLGEAHTRTFVQVVAGFS